MAELFTFYNRQLVDAAAYYIFRPAYLQCVSKLQNW